MATPSEFYLVQVEACERSAGEAELPHLREKFLRSRDAWQALADREAAIAAARERREAERAALETCTNPGIPAA